MSETILLGRKGELIPVPRQVWEGHLAHAPEHSKHRLSFMSQEHHLVRYFVVREMPHLGKPIEAGLIAKTLALPLAQVEAILDELERNLFFLVRDERGAVVWAYPITVAETAHRLSFSTGEQLFAAWAEDTIAAPFVQGRLRNEYLSLEISTACGHCGRPMQMVIDSNLNYQIKNEGAVPLVFEPSIDWATFSEPNIIHAYWRNSIFFWSEEHAREFWASGDHVNGEFLTLAQCIYATPIAQGTLFGFNQQTW